jgi:ribonuclease-3
MDKEIDSNQPNVPYSNLPVPDFSLPPPTIPNPPETRPERKADNYDRRRRSRSREKTRKRSRSRSRDSRRRSRSREHRSMSYSSQSSRYDRDSKSYRRETREYSSSSSSNRLRDHKSPYRSSSYRRSPPSRSSSRRHSPPQRTEDSRQKVAGKEVRTERSKILEKWRKNFCETSEQITKKLQELANDEEQVSWIRSSPADIFYNRVKDNVVEATPRLEALCKLFDDELLQRAKNIKENLPPYKPPDRRRKIHVCKHKCK